MQDGCQSEFLDYRIVIIVPIVVVKTWSGTVHDIGRNTLC